MTKREYFNKLFDLFESDGWQVFLEEVSRNEQVFKDSLITGEGHDLYRAQGALYYIGVVKNFENAVKNSYEDNEGELDAPLPV